MNFARLEEEDLVNFENIELRQSQRFDLPDYESTVSLNQAFSSLVLRKGEISPCVTDGNETDVRGSSIVPKGDGVPLFGTPVDGLHEVHAAKITEKLMAVQAMEEEDGTPQV